MTPIAVWKTHFHGFLDPTTWMDWSQDSYLYDEDFNYFGVFGTAVVIWDSQTGEALHEFPHPDIVWSAGWSPDESQIVTGAEDGIIRIWDVQTKSVLHQWQAHKVGNVKVSSVDWSPDGAYILSASEDGITRIWKIGVQIPQNSPTGDDPGITRRISLANGLVGQSMQS